MPPDFTTRRSSENASTGCATEQKTRGGKKPHRMNRRQMASALHNFELVASPQAVSFRWRSSAFPGWLGRNSQLVIRIKNEIEARASTDFQYARIFGQVTKSRGSEACKKPAIEWSNRRVVMRRRRGIPGADLGVLVMPALSGAQIALAHHHDHLPLAAAIKLAKKDSLPASQQQFSTCEWKGHG